MLISDTGAAFYSVLTFSPQSIKDLAKNISLLFSGINFDLIESDALLFFSDLADRGFIASGINANDCHVKFVDSKWDTLSSEDSSKVLASPLYQLRERVGYPILSSVQIEIVSVCNERCVHCYIPLEAKTHVMEDDLFYRLVDESEQLGVVHLTITGGEPLLHKSAINFFRYVREKGFSVSVLTNAILIDDLIISEMRQNPLLGVQVSIYSMDDKIHDAITQIKGSLNKTLMGIEKLINAQIPVQISCPILTQNFESYRGVVAWGCSKGIDVNYDPVIIGQYNHNNSNLKYRLSFGDVEKYFRERINDAWYKEVREEVLRNKLRKQDDYVCNICQSSICVSEKGNVYPCAGWQSCVLGNLMDSSLSEIWTSSNKINYLRGVRRSEFLDCKNCEEVEYCSICMVKNANESSAGNPLEVNKYYCEMARIKRRVAEGYCKSINSKTV